MPKLSRPTIEGVVRNTQLTCFVTPALHAAIKRAADEDGISMTELVIRAAGAYLKLKRRV